MAVALVVVVETGPTNVTIAKKKATCPKIAPSRKVCYLRYLKKNMIFLEKLMSCEKTGKIKLNS